MKTMITEKCRIPGCTGELVAQRTLLGRLITADPHNPEALIMHECNHCPEGFAWLDGIYPRALIPGFDDLDTTMEDVVEDSI